ncbi:hypothetical protein CO661_14130 [Sinorhizobium fredii]|uniref:NusG-like N-terminal domain-containing protein n=1 Tax=Rhizobium fredii TaxID=380 RepID=A0A2A6LYK8_RHIFR|nr:transcription termination/antitermination NusG family protein [Sinorhizobium fredii]PDT47316.1 hypothetical protein CO661_14130 [Sinorhizobium fredii]
MTKTRWYAIRIKPGYQRMAAEDARLSPDRYYETLIERNCREKGFSVFMPSFYREIKHHRTNRIITRRLPLLVGYAFVDLPRLNFEELRKVDGVMCLLKIDREYGPIEFSGEVIEKLILEDLDEKHTFMIGRYARQEAERINRVRNLRGQLRKILPKGRGARISMTLEADKAIESLNAHSRERVLNILSELRQLADDNGIDLKKKAV